MDYPYSDITLDENKTLKTKIKSFKKYIENRTNYFTSLSDDSEIDETTKKRIRYKIAELDNLLNHFKFVFGENFS